MNKLFTCLHNVVFISWKRCKFSEINEKKKPNSIIVFISHPLFLAKPLSLLNLQTVQAPHLLGNPLPLYWFFVNTLPPKNRIFQWNPKNIKVFHPKPPSYVLKLTKFLIKKISVWILSYDRENIFVCKLFFSLNISGFRLFFMQKLHPSLPLKKVTLLFPIKSL